MKINTNLPVVLADGTPARIVATDRRSASGYPLVVLYETTTGNEATEYATLEGYTRTMSPTLMNKFVYDGLQAGMKLNPNTGAQPDDWDSTRPCRSFGGTNLSAIGRWGFHAYDDDVALYWPKPETITLELTKEEVSTLKDICALIGGPPTSRRKHIDTLARKLPGPLVGWYPKDTKGDIFFN